MTRRRGTFDATQPIAIVRGTAPGESKLGPYNVIAPLARGGMAGVYLAEHLHTKERVALKVLDACFCEQDDVVNRMLTERTISQQVRHAGLLDILVADRSSTGVPYLVMEFLDGENLGTLFGRGRIELDAIVAIGAQIAGALSALHAVGYIHCDVKPDNVFVLYQSAPSGWPRIKVIDYGVARTVDEPPSPTSAIAGTPCYMAPEQWHGVPTTKSDVYSLGCMLYELVAGEQPFHGTLPQLMTAHHEKLADRLGAQRSDVPVELERWIGRAMAKDPGLRPTMNELAAAFGRLLGDCFTSDALGAVG